MSGLTFKKAERKKAKLKLAIAGPSGSGKTMSALRLAKGIGGKIALIDTENESASLYSDRFEFDTLSLHPPYTTDTYLNAMRAAVNAGYNVVIIDSISHQWAGEGGVLSRKEQMDARGGNSFTNWGKLTPEQEKFKSAILHFGAHLIVTMRSKQEYVLSENDKGKQAPKKVGMAPVQREGMEYEFTTVFDVAMNHEAAVSKDRTGLFSEQYFVVTEDIGKRLAGWLNTGGEPERRQELAPQYDAEAPTHTVSRTTVSITPPEPPTADPSDLADYKVGLGKKYYGKKLKDIPREDLISYIKWLDEDAAKKGHALSYGAVLLKSAAERYLYPEKFGSQNPVGPTDETDVSF